MKSGLCQSGLVLEQGDHSCLFYENDPAEQMPALIPFIQEGLSHDEQVIYIADDQTVEQLQDRLQQSGINVAVEMRRERLKLWTRREWRQAGELDSRQKSRQVRQFMDQAWEKDFKGVRFGVEMTWTLGPDISARKLKHWEATLNNIFVPGFPGRIVCQYNRSRLGPEVILAALHTHPLAIIGERVCSNLFYQGPLMLKSGSNGNGDGNGKASAAQRADWMLSQLQRPNVANTASEDALWRQPERRGVESSSGVTRGQIKQPAEEWEVDLPESTCELSERNSQLEAFVHTVAHDLRAPLRSMQAFSSMLLEECAQQLNEAATNYARRIAGSAEAMDILVLNLLAYSRMARSQISLSAVEPKMVWAAAVAQNEQTIHERKAQVEVVPPLPAVLAHETALAQVLANLLNNALKFVQFGVTPRVRFWAEDRSDLVRLWVEDNGIGIAPEHQERVFRIFERLNGGAYGGTGIGLSIVRKGIERMGGRVGVESAPGGGSRFWIELSKG